MIEVRISEKTDTPELAEVSLTRFVGYFLRLGTFGFGGPIALAGHMDLWPRNSQFILVMSVTEFLAPPPSPLRLSYLHS